MEDSKIFRGHYMVWWVSFRCPPWNQNPPQRSSCATPETETVLSLRWYCRKHSKRYAFSLQNKMAAKNRWGKKQPCNTNITFRAGLSEESDLMAGCIPLASLWQRQLDRNGKADLLTSQKPHDTPVPGEDSQFHQIAEHAKDLQQELLESNTFANCMQSRYVVRRLHQNTLILLISETQAQFSYLELLLAMEVVE